MKMAPKGSGTIRRYGFVGVGMALLEEVCQCRVDFLGFVCVQGLSELPVACKKQHSQLQYHICPHASVPPFMIVMH